MKRALLAGGLVVALVVGTVWAAYTRDLSGDGQKALLIALESIIGDGIAVTETGGTAPVERQPLQLAAVAIAAPGTPVVLAANGTFATKLTVQAGRATAANTSLVSLCSRTAPAAAFTAYTTQRQIELAPGDTREVNARLGEKFDVNDYAVDGVTAGDGFRIEYVPAP